MTWVYRKTEARLWTVGFYDPQGAWCPEGPDFDNPSRAADEAARLNGGSSRPVMPSDLAPQAEVLYRRLQRAARIVGADYTKRPIQELIEQAAEAIRDAGHILERRFGHSDSPNDPDALTALRWLSGQHPALQPATGRVAVDPARMIAEVQAEHAATWPSCHTAHGGRADDAPDQYGRRDGIRSNDGEPPDTCMLCNGTIDDHVEEVGEGPHGEEVHNYRCLIAELSDVIHDIETSMVTDDEEAEPDPIESEWVRTLKLVETAYKAKLDG